MGAERCGARRVAAVCAVAWLALAVVSAWGAPSMEVRFPDGRIERFDTRLEGARGEYLTADDVSLLYGASKFWRSDLLKMTLRIGASRVKITVDNRNVVIDDRVIHLREPVLFRDGMVRLPLQLVVEILPDLVTGYAVEWDEGRRLLSIGSPVVVLDDVRLNSVSGGTEMVITPSGKCDVFPRDEAAGIALRFPGARPGRSPLPLPAEGSLVDSLAWSVEGDTAVLQVTTDSAMTDYSVEKEGRPERIVVRLSTEKLLRRGGREKEDLVVLTTPKSVSPPRRTVVIDAGHGGDDPGCAGEQGLVEKDYVLAMARLLRDRLARDHGVTAILTRDGDLDLSLTARTEIANRAGAGLFVSLHVNGSPDRSLSGAEVYVYSPGREVKERVNAVVEEATSRYGSALVGGVIDQDFRFIPWEAVQTSYRGASDKVAGRIVRALKRLDIGVPRGVKEGPFQVLAGADMPAVLVEIGFATSPEDEAVLLDDRMARRIAGALAGAIGGYIGSGS